MTERKRVAAIDCGTNSIRLLVAEAADPGTGLVDVHREMRVVRLGRGVDATGRFDDTALRDTLAAARDYAQICADNGVRSVRFIATSATRDAANAEEFLGGVHEIFGECDVTPEVITGLAEAQLSFAGATAELVAAERAGIGEAEAPYLVVDIGGGSTEFVRGSSEVEQSISLDIGCVRMTERHLQDDPPTETQVWAALTDITEAIDHAARSVDFSGVRTLIGLAGSVTTTSAHALELPTYDPQRIHGSVISTVDVVDATNDLLRMGRAEREGLPYMHPGRVDVIGAGALIWRTVVQRLVRDAGLASVRTSEHDILDGIAWSQIQP
ncbi:MAG: Ppx/GppA phosphatase family protein [Ornithinimicrobium sp.]